MVKKKSSRKMKMRPRKRKAKVSIYLVGLFILAVSVSAQTSGLFTEPGGVAFANVGIILILLCAIIIQLVRMVKKKS